MAIQFLVEQISAYILVFCRMGGMIFFNPLFMRRNIPTQVKIALVLGITVLITPLVSMPNLAVMTDFVFMWVCVSVILLFVIYCGGYCGYGLRLINGKGL